MAGAGACLPLELVPCGSHGPARAGAADLPRTVRAEAPSSCRVLLATHPSKELCGLRHCGLIFSWCLRCQGTSEILGCCFESKEMVL